MTSSEHMSYSSKTNLNHGGVLITIGGSDNSLESSELESSEQIEGISWKGGGVEIDDPQEDKGLSLSLKL